MCSVNVQGYNREKLVHHVVDMDNMSVQATLDEDVQATNVEGAVLT